MQVNLLVEYIGSSKQELKFLNDATRVSDEYSVSWKTSYFFGFEDIKMIKKPLYSARKNYICDKGYFFANC